MLIKKKRSQFEGVALVSDNDGITILGFASRPLLAQCLCISFIASTVEGMQEPKKVNCTSEVRQLIAVQDHISISRSCASIITSQLLHLYVAAIIMTNITIVNTCAVLWHPLCTLFVGIVPEKKRLHLGANLVRTFCQNSHCPNFSPPPPFPTSPSQ